MSPPGEHGFWFWVAFWIPAVLLMFAFARFLFREQWGELKTLRFLTNQLGPYYDEFDPPNLNIWVNRCAPHVWHGWRLRDFSGLEGFATAGCLAQAAARFEAESRAGLVFEGRLDKVLKIHFLDLRFVGPGPAPADIELRLRVESQASDALRGPTGPVAGTRTELSQLQHFWTLRHDGRQWRLAAIESAQGDHPPLPPAPPLPGLLDWKRAPAAVAAGDETKTETKNETGESQ